MTISIDATHDAGTRSWLPSANAPGTDFPLQNLPIGVFRGVAERDADFRGGVAIGDQILDLAALASLGVETGRAQAAFVAAADRSLNGFLSLGHEHWHAFRAAVFALLEGDDSDAARSRIGRLQRCLMPQADAVYRLPTDIGDYTDFYTSLHHAENVGRLFRGGQPLVTANFKTMPIAYHGRASTVGLSGERVRRPMGQYLPDGGSDPVYGPCRKLDYELELGFFVGTGNDKGTRIGVDAAPVHLYGACLLNDWSARDIQMWESQPLGPFLAKNFATTLSPWIVSLAALAPYRVAPPARSPSDPKRLAYLDSVDDGSHGAYDIVVEASIETASMRARRAPPRRVSLSSFRHQYWTIAQMLAHHTVGGCAMRTGDLLGSGTISGPGESEAGALIELSRSGATPVEVGDGESRAFLEDGDVVQLRAWCEGEGRARIGFGVNRGQVLPATDQ